MINTKVTLEILLRRYLGYRLATVVIEPGLKSSPVSLSTNKTVFVSDYFIHVD